VVFALYDERERQPVVPLGMDIGYIDEYVDAAVLTFRGRDRNPVAKHFPQAVAH